MIGIFDSGIGGLTVVKKIFENLDKYQVLYFGDTARTPYGNKGETTIKKYAIEDAQFLIDQGAKIIVVACNTVSAVAIDTLKKTFDLPIFEVVTPAAQKAVASTKNKRTGVIGTRLTIDSGIYNQLIKKLDPKIKVFSQAASLLVPLIEENWLKKTETRRIVKRYLHPLRSSQIDTLILACTHYPFLRRIIQIKIGRRVKIIDPGEEVVKQIQEFLKKNPAIEKTLIKGSKHKFFVSDLTPKFQTLASQWLGQKIKLEKVDINLAS